MRHGMTMAPAGLVLVLALVAAGPENPPSEAGMPDGHFGCRAAPILLLTRPDVQAELQLEPRQISGARNVIARLRQRGAGLKGKAGPEAVAERGRIDDEMIRWLTSTLKAEQLERLQEVIFQWEGAEAMTRPHVATHLNLSIQQLNSIDPIVKQLEAERRTRGSLTPAEIGSYSNKAFAVLTPSQKESWGVLLGMPCRFTIGGRTVVPWNPTDSQIRPTQVSQGH